MRGREGGREEEGERESVCERERERVCVINAAIIYSPSMCK